MGTIISVNISDKKGIAKTPVDKIILDDKGVVNDSHAGDWHRQISLLAKESIDDFSKVLKREIIPGEFAENVTTFGVDLLSLRPLDTVIINNNRMLITQIGKKCHGTGCSIYSEAGACVMPKEGIFAKVIDEGSIQAGDTIELEKKILNIKVITLSDRASKGIYEDKSGPAVINAVKKFFEDKKRPLEFRKSVIPDDRMLLQSEIESSANQFDIVITTGGTGIGPKDITPDVVIPLLDKEITGIMELIRVKYGAEKPNVLISRSVAGTIGTTLVYTLPGSVKAVNEYLTEILPTIEHSIYMINELDLH